MNLRDYILLAVLLLGVIAAPRSIHRQNRRGGCCGCCGHCVHHCQTSDFPAKKESHSNRGTL
jgi:hypothetical protein